MKVDQLNSIDGNIIRQTSPSRMFGWWAGVFTVFSRKLTISFIDHRKTFEQHRALMVKHEKLRAQKRGRGGNRKEKDSTQKDKTATNK